MLPQPRQLIDGQADVGENAKVRYSARWKDKKVAPATTIASAL